MKVSEYDLQALDLQALADRLLSLGAGLAGRNLTAASWLEIARALRRRATQSHLLMRLRSARTRADALRVLRVARHFGRDSQRSARVARGARAAGPRRLATPAARFAELSAKDQMVLEEPHRHHDHCSCFRTDTFPFDYRVWQAWDLLARGARATSIGERLSPALRAALTLAAGSMEPNATAARFAPRRHPPLRGAADPVEYVRSAFASCENGSANARAGGLPPITAADLEALSVLSPTPSEQAARRCEQEFREHRLFVLALMLAGLWVRPAHTWCRPQGERRELVNSLIDHLFVRFPVPALLYDAWDLELPWAGQPKDIVCFVLLARGFPLKSAAARFGWRFPGRFLHHLWQAPAGLGMPAGLLWTEIMRLGGSQLEFQRLRRWRVFLEIDPTGVVDPGVADPQAAAADHEPGLAFLRGTIRWLITHRSTLTEASSDDILCWAGDRYTVGQRPGRQRFSWQGRTPRAALAASRAWMVGRGAGLQEPLAWASRGWDWTGGDRNEWVVRELLSSRELFVEGAALEHCVASYDASCHEGRSAIFSFTCDRVPQLTVEIDATARLIRQAKGIGNREPTTAEWTLIGTWLREVVWRRPPGQPSLA